MTSNNPSAPKPVLIALGANIPSPAGLPAKTLEAALHSLGRLGLQIVAISPFYETDAWPSPGDLPFMNAVALARTDIQPVALLALLHEVETAFGRKRSVPNAPRTLDLDILDYDGLVQSGPPVLPHPRVAERRFVLEPLQAVAPGWRHPVSGQTVDALLKAL